MLCLCERIAWLKKVRTFCEKKAQVAEEEASMWIQSAERLHLEIKNLKEKVND